MAASVPVSGQLHAPFGLPKDDAQVPADWSNRPVFLNRRAASRSGISHTGPREVLLEFVIIVF
jgi:hypothetical protein